MSRRFVQKAVDRMEGEMRRLADDTLGAKLSYESYLVNHGKYKALERQVEEFQKALKTQEYDQ